MGVLEVYKDTLNDGHSFPLIMVVGREGNSQVDEVINETGFYDFEESSDCNFWNAAYSIYGWANNLETYQVKALCKSKKCSPIIFTDASPFGIENEVIDKNSKRENQPEIMLQKNVENVFSHRNVVDRLKLVILAGHDTSKKLKHASELFKEKCDQCKIPWIETQFMFSNNRKNNIDKIEKDNKTNIFREAHSEFIATGT